MIYCWAEAPLILVIGRLINISIGKAVFYQRVDTTIVELPPKYRTTLKHVRVAIKLLIVLCHVFVNSFRICRIMFN